MKWTTKNILTLIAIGVLGVGALVANLYGLTDLANLLTNNQQELQAGIVSYTTVVE